MKSVWTTKKMVDSKIMYPTDVCARPIFTPVLVLLPSNTDLEKLKDEGKGTQIYDEKKL